MVEPIEGLGYKTNLPFNFAGFWFPIVETALQKLGYECPTIREFKKTLGYLNKIRKGQYYSITESIPAERTRNRSWDQVTREFVYTRDAVINFHKRDVPKDSEIHILHLRGQSKKAEEIANVIEKEIARISELYQEYLDMGGGCDTPEKQKLLVEIGFYEPDFFRKNQKK